MRDLWRAEHVVGPDATPDDVRLARAQLLTVLERSAAIGRPAHLPHAGVPLDPLHPERWVELSAAETSDESVQRARPSRYLLGGQPAEIAQEPRPSLLGRH